MYTEDILRYYKTINDVNQLTNQIQCRPTIRAVTKYVGYIYICFSYLLLPHLPLSLTLT